MSHTPFAKFVVVPLLSIVAVSGLPNDLHNPEPKHDDSKNFHRRDADPFYPWAGLGDSFAAGPGAGEPYEDLSGTKGCYRSKGAYPAQLRTDFPFPGQDLQFLACTGDVVDDMINTRLEDMGRHAGTNAPLYTESADVSSKILTNKSSRCQLAATT